MHADSPRYSPASRVQSFYFYIPHERLRPGGHLHCTFLSTPSPVTQWDRSLKGGHLVSKLEGFLPYKEDRSYGTAQTVKPSARLCTLIDNFRPFILVLETRNTKLRQ